MQASCLVGIGIFLLAACAPAGPPAGGNPGPAVQLSASQKAAIGKKIWQNECGGTVNGLTTWNAGEEFPSLGIGHFIWYPAGFNGRFQESWPQFVAFAIQQGANPPAVARERSSPWTSKAQFQKEFNDPKLSGLRTWLAGNIGVQTDFIIARSRAALPKMIAAAPPSEQSPHRSELPQGRRLVARDLRAHRLREFQRRRHPRHRALSGPGLGTAASARRHERRARRPAGRHGVLRIRETHALAPHRELPARPRRKTLGGRLAQPLQHLRPPALTGGPRPFDTTLVATTKCSETRSRDIPVARAHGWRKKRHTLHPKRSGGRQPVPTATPSNDAPPGYSGGHRRLPECALESTHEPCPRGLLSSRHVAFAKHPAAVAMRDHVIDRAGIVEAHSSSHAVGYAALPPFASSHANPRE